MPNTPIADLPLPALHAAVMAAQYATDTGDAPHDGFYRLLTSYQSADARQLATLATTCDRRLTRSADVLPLDLASAYARLARLARWRAEQLGETRS